MIIFLIVYISLVAAMTCGFVYRNKLRAEKDYWKFHDAYFGHCAIADELRGLPDTPRKQFNESWEEFYFRVECWMNKKKIRL